MYYLTRISLTYPKATLGVILAVTMILGAGLPNLRTEFGYRVLIGDDHPSIRSLDEFIELFGGGLPLQIVWECGEGFPCSSVFDDISIGMAHELAQQLEGIGSVQSILGPSNAALLVPEAAGFAIRRLVENNKLAPDRASLAVRALDDSLWKGRLVSDDGKVASIVVQAQANNGQEDADLVDAVLRELQPHQALGFTFHLVGDAIATVLPGRDLAASTRRLVPLTVGVVGVVLLFLMPSWRTVAITLATIAVSLIWTFGVLGWVGWPQDGILEVLAPLLLIVGTSDAVHFVTRRGSICAGGQLGDLASLETAASDVGWPCLVTTLTTSAAFFSFVTSALDTFVRFGIISGLGISACLVLTFSLLPILWLYFPDGLTTVEKNSRGWEFSLKAIARTTKRRASSILAASAVISAVAAIGWARHLRVDNNWLESFGDQSTAVEWIHFVEERLSPVDTLELDIAFASEEEVFWPATLREIERFSDHLESLEGLGRSRSAIDLVRRLNRVLNEDDPLHERTAASSRANAELFELIRLEGPDVLESWLALDQSRMRISVDASERTYVGRGRILRSVREYINTQLPDRWRVNFSGALALNYDWIRDVQETQARSFPTAFALVGLVMAVYLRSAGLALLGMLPTLLPVVATLGAMGWIGLSLDVGRAMIAAVLLGIAVDDAIHILARYKSNRNAGNGVTSSIEDALVAVGPAVVTTSIALSLGFLALLASPWQTISSFGFFVSLAVLGALASTVFVLPAALFVWAQGEDA